MTLAPRGRLLHLLGGFMLTQALGTVARPGVAEDEWRRLLAQNGFELQPVTPDAFLLEAVPV